MDIKFSKEDFSSLSFVEFPGKWNAVGLSDLSIAEQSILINLMALLPNPIDAEEVDNDDLLLVKAEKGMLKEIYGPSIFQGEKEGLVFKLGGNEFPVTQEGNEFRCGQLVGELQFADKEIVYKDRSGDEEIEYPFYPCTCVFYNDEDEAVYRVRFAVDPVADPKPAKIKALCRKGESVAHFLNPVPVKGQGGGEAIKMRDMEVGEWAISDIKALPAGQYGPSWILELEDGRSVWAQGLVKTALAGGYERKPGQPLTLAITRIQPSSNGKVYVDCALRQRPPKGGEPGKPEPQKKQAVKPVAATAAAQPNYDDIPF